MTVALRCDAADGREFTAAMRGWAKTLLGLLELESAELSVVLTTDPVIRGLNREFRGKDAPTDVLSFPQLDHGEKFGECGGKTAVAPPILLGDVVISIETALRQAHAMRILPTLRLRTLLIHGMLHLLGYDHEESPAEARRMFARERKLAALLESQPSSRRLRPMTVN